MRFSSPLNRLQKLCWMLCLGAALFACASTTTPKPESQIAIAMAAVELQQTPQRPALAQLLTVGISVFELPPQTKKKAQLGDWVVKDILEVEKQYLPILLRNTLQRSNQWAAVRLLPKPDASFDLQISGKIIHSNGEALKLQVSAIDSRGQQWLNKSYEDRYSSSQVLDSGRFNNECSLAQAGSQHQAYQNIYRQIANDLLALRQNLSSTELSDIRQIAEIKHAQDLSPQAFAGLLAKDSGGLWQLKRLLSAADPMQQRVDNMRARHHLYIDTVDDHYQGLHQQMQGIYDLWLRYSCERALEIKLRNLKGGDKRSFKSGGFSALNDNYRRYKISKIFEQEWNQLASSFSQEVKPALVELNDRVYTLSGTVENQYQQWRKLLREFYRLQTGE